MSKTRFILTSEVNEYNQEGEYFEAVFDEAPTLQQLSRVVYNVDLEALDDEGILLVAHIKRGGGRQETEDLWYNLTEVTVGERFNNK